MTRTWRRRQRLLHHFVVPLPRPLRDGGGFPRTSPACGGGGPRSGGGGADAAGREKTGMFDATYETLITDVPRPSVARITLNKPAQMNAYSWRMTQELQAAVAAYRDDDGLRCLVVTGSGTR